jgi:glycosyltransferase involved in cell wall biosynthesis
MNTHLKIVIPSYNSLKWLRRTLHSVARQTYRNFQVCVIDDASTQSGQKELIEQYAGRYGWKTIYRSTNQGALANIIDGIKRLAPEDEDVILLLDGDDWLFNHQVFARIAQEYHSPSVFLTYGQFITYPRWQIGFCKPLDNQLYLQKTFRHPPFIFSHLRTFRFKLWNAIDEKDFMDPYGRYYKTAWDLAIMYPLLELCGGQGCKFIEQLLYVYNMDNPLNDCIAHKTLQNDTAQQILKKAPYVQKFYSHYLPHTEKKRIWVKNRWVSFYKKFITPTVYKLAIRKMLKKCLCMF